MLRFYPYMQEYTAKTKVIFLCNALFNVLVNRNLFRMLMLDTLLYQCAALANCSKDN